MHVLYFLYQYLVHTKQLISTQKKKKKNKLKRTKLDVYCM